MHKVTRAIVVSSVFALLTTTSAFAQTNLQPSLKTITPTKEQTVYSQDVPVIFSVENFEIVDFQTNPYIVAGQGHIHLWLDDQTPTKESAEKVVQDNFTYKDVPYGNHTLKAELVNNDHSSLIPPVTTTVTFKTEAMATPTPAPVSGFDKNTAIVILVVVALVIIAAWWYTKDDDDEMPATNRTPTGPARPALKKKTKAKKVAKRSSRRR